jgi:hypothetical protein
MLTQHKIICCVSITAHLGEHNNMFLVQYVIESYYCYKLLLIVSERTDALLHSACVRSCVRACVCVRAYVWFLI